MAERKVSVRLGVVGGKEVEATFLDIGNKGSAAMQRLGNESEQAFAKVSRSSMGASGGLQNVGFQIQDFAVQVGAGTSATQALAQQLPQLLSGFGLLGVVVGTASAILIPVAGYLFGIGQEAESASDKVETLVDRIGELQRINQNFSTEGVQGLVDKYGELNAAVLLLIERQRAYAEQQAMTAARDVTANIGEELDDVVYSLREYDAVLTLIARNNYGDVEAQRQQALLAITESLNDEYGLTLDQARELAAAFADLRAADSIPEMADATARLTGLLQDSKFAGTELEGTLLASEDALRQLNAEGSGIGGWLGAAIDWASALGGNLWDAARAAAAVRGAQSAPAGRGDPRQFETDPYWRDRYFPDPEPMRTPTPGRTGSAGGGGRSATSDLEREAERIMRSTRTEAERYAEELAKLESIKAAGLITDETYNRQLQALSEQYQGQTDVLTTLQDRLEDFVKTSQDIAGGIGDAFVEAFSAGSDAVADFVKTGKIDFSSLITNFIADLARLAAQKYIFGPLANMLGGALGGLGGAFANILHEGGIAGSGGGRRSVNPAIFAGAPRFHSGGLAGDEVPAILQRGERVLSRAETAAYDRGGSPTVVFNVKDAQSLRQSRAQIAADAARAVAMGRRNS
ncbi:tape measure protein [Rhodobacter phage RcKai]|nr:tape measure protein [Rhodobacter phage RcFrancesLouise]UUV43589.1 tape measure protein [Rhodobacter phage RcKai]UUV44157.1 tape measure protein [Rhodobacter phage RcMamaDuck]UUV44870.1 tape measure protein [Rhodobacter phage RcSwan]